MEEKIRDVIKNNGILGFKNKGILISPFFKSGLLGEDLYSWWYDFEEKRIKAGVFHNLDEIEIIKSRKYM